ncbi:tyrosine-type recombinase/integrase [Trichlorobacter lovleyi]|uniref:tyrosine-type recombinase/integrase n=1 Tax=Trichlorobacter lovleyi TaxID=313985 RepID=UPI003D115645
MPKRVLPLSDLKISKAKPQDKEYRLFDGGGLYLAVTPSGGKLWRIKYRFEGKAKELHLGAYPVITLAEARQKLLDTKRTIAGGVDPGAVKKARKQARLEKEANSFEVIAREWHGRYVGQWTAGHAVTIMSRLERDVFPYLGSEPVEEIKAPAVLKLLRRVESRGALESAHRIRTVIGQVLRYAVATGRAERDCTGDLKGALPPATKKHLAALTDPKDVAPLLRAIDGFQGSFVVKCALRLASIFFVRPGELRQAEWTEFDFDAAQWNIPAERMKMKLPHIVPLSEQAIAILKELRPLTGHSKYVFPSHRTPLRCMSNNAVNAALRRMGFEKDEMCAHGFRAMARTILDEVMGFRIDFIEHQLAHAVKDANGRAYNRTAHLEARRQMMQQWADYLDGLKAGAKVLPIRQAG